MYRKYGDEDGFPSLSEGKKKGLVVEIEKSGSLIGINEEEHPGGCNMVVRAIGKLGGSRFSSEMVWYSAEEKFT